jgi:hypothetical protein
MRSYLTLLQVAHGFLRQDRTVILEQDFKFWGSNPLISQQRRVFSH